ncbi:hypothetical protein, partial [Exiguobacterium sp. s28]|uniref:hypothetical protein n=1 Tax=Exiguobacterium sp. s28 TaxID=2751238 RepID=UPI001BE51B89
LLKKSLASLPSSSFPNPKNMNKEANRPFYNANSADYFQTERHYINIMKHYSTQWFIFRHTHNT